MKGIIFSLVLLACALALKAQHRVPHSRSSVMIDGRFEAAEWQKALLLKVNDSTYLYAQQDGKNLYICLRTATPQPAMVMVDFYLTQRDTLLNLHASAKLGERKWNGTTYGEWVWWNNTGWQATVARLDKIEERKFLRDEAKEFQLRKSRFSDKQLRLMFDVSYPAHMVMRFPTNADTTTSKDWVVLHL